MSPESQTNQLVDAAINGLMLNALGDFDPRSNIIGMGHNGGDGMNDGYETVLRKIASSDPTPGGVQYQHSLA